jgi:mycothiol synthase
MTRSGELLMRPPTFDDVVTIAEFRNLCSMYDENRQAGTVESWIRQLQTPGFDLDRDMRLVFTPDNTLIGIGLIWDVQPSHTQPAVWGRVHPEHRRQGVGTRLMEWLEQRAHETVALAPPEARVVMESAIDSTDEGTNHLLLAQGFVLVRQYHMMHIDLDAPPPTPELPEGIAIKSNAELRDDRGFYDAFVDSFRDHWGFMPHTFEHWIRSSTNEEYYDPSLWFAAVDGEEIAGICICAKKAHDAPEKGSVEELGVRRAWRKRGIGVALLHHAFGEYYRRGIYKVSLGVDTESLTGATRLYERAGMHVEKTHNRYQKELRAGQELAPQALEE